jgi:hypothetical protein
VDGLPLADAQRGAIDISLLPLERFARAEIHRGLVPVGLGGVGGAGAVNLVTREDQEGSACRLFAGSFGDVGGRLSHEAASSDGSRRGMLLAHGRRIDNRFQYTPWIPDWVGPEPTLEPRQRINADFAEWGLFGLGELSGMPGLARVSGGYFRRDGGRPGPQNVAETPVARVRHERLDGRLALGNRARTLTAEVALARQEDRLYDPAGEVGFDPYERTCATGGDALGRLVWSPRRDWSAVGLGLTLGGDWRYQWYREANDGVEDPRRNRHTTAAFASLALELSGPRLVVTPAWRWQRSRDDFPPVPALPWLPEEAGVRHEQDSVSPSLGTQWQVLGEAVILEAHWHESVREPSWIELFGQPGGLLGNRELVPEEITGRDLGLRLAAADLGGAVRLTAFEQVTEKTIVYSYAGPGLARPENIGRSRTRGLELEGVLERGAVDLSANVTWQQARDRGGADPTYEGKALPYLSDWETYTELGWRLGVWRPSASLVHRSASYRTRYNRDIDRTPERTILNLALARRFRDGPWGEGREATLTAEILNVTDNDVYDVENYPLPGRSVRVSLHWR